MKLIFANSFLILLAMVISGTGLAQSHDHDHPDVEIHTFQNGETYTSCSFVLHYSLTQEELNRFNKEAGSIIYFQPLSAASSLGKWKVDGGISITRTPIDQTAGAWNNTFAHPEEDEEGPHWLGDQVVIPNIRYRVGITDNIEVGTYLTRDFNANYGFWGADVKYTHEVPEKEDMFVAFRVSHSHLFGPETIKLHSSAVDVLFSKKWYFVEPYAGLSTSFNHARETSDLLDLKHANAMTYRALFGARFSYKWFYASAEYDFSRLQTFSLKLGLTL